MALTNEDRLEVRRLARLEAAAAIAGPTTFDRTTGRFHAIGDHPNEDGNRRNIQFDQVDAAEGGNPFA